MQGTQSNQFKPQQFKAKPMPNFSNPFVPQHFKAPATTFQEFNLSCYSKDSRNSSKLSSRCETPESLQFSSFWSDKNVSPSPKKAGFKARPMPNFSQPFFPVLSRSANSPFSSGAGNERSKQETRMTWILISHRTWILSKCNVYDVISNRRKSF